MRFSLKGKMILSYLVVALLTVLVVSALIRLTSGRSLMNLVVEKQTAALQEAVQSYYTTNGSLDGFFADYLSRIRRVPPDGQVDYKEPPPQQPGDPAFRPDLRDVRGLTGLVDTYYRAVMPTLGYDVGETVPREQITRSIAVEVDGQTVAWVLPDTSFEFKLSAEEELFLQRTTLAIGLAALAGVLAAVATGILLAGRLLKPIRLLTSASQALAAGQLEQQVPVTSRDELGQLTATFNQMSADLVKADQQRKRITADITHDLSTPLQIISGYIEMLEGGDVPLTPQRVAIIKTELEHLRRLVGDLTTLTQVEASGLEIQLQRAQPGALLERAQHAFEPIAASQGVTLTLNVPEGLPDILIDEGRMMQVLKNLLENALRYTLRGGIITLSAAGNDPVELRVRDSGEGIDPEDLPYVFERFYRADRSRGGNAGKMGLGLSISKALVTVQGGTISAESAGKGQGTAVIIRFPPAPAG